MAQADCPGGGHSADRDQQQSTTNSTTEEKKSTNPESVEMVGLMSKVVSSIFNNTHVIPINGLNDNLPLLNMKSGANSDWIDIGNASYLGLDKNLNEQNGSYVDLPKEFNSWELDTNEYGYVIKGNDIPPLYPNHRPDLKHWQYDPTSGFLYTFVKSTPTKDSTGKKSSKPTYEKKYYTERHNSYDFVQFFKNGFVIFQLEGMLLKYDNNNDEKASNKNW